MKKLIVLLALALPAFCAPPAIVNAAYLSAGGCNPTCNSNLGFTPTAGNAIIIMESNFGSGTGVTWVSATAYSGANATGSLLDTFTIGQTAHPGTGSGNGEYGVVFAWNVAGGEASIKTTFTGFTGSGGPFMYVLEVSGLGLTNPFDSVATPKDTGFGTNAWSSNSLTTTAAGDFVIGLAINAQAGGTSTSTPTSFSTGPNEHSTNPFYFYQVVGAAGSYSMTGGTWTSTGNQIIASLASFKAGLPSAGATETHTTTPSVTATPPDIPEPTRPVTLLIDTDIDENPDDSGDFNLAMELMTLGDANVIGVITSSANDYSAGCAYGILNYYHRGSIPIGAWQGPTAVTTNPAPGNAEAVRADDSAYTLNCATRYGKGSTDTRTHYEDAVNVYRRVLANAADHSVVLYTGGYYQALWVLINSPAHNGAGTLGSASTYSVASLGTRQYGVVDSIADTGIALLQKKLRMWVPAGGRYPTNTSTVEHNFGVQPAVTAAVLGAAYGPSSGTVNVAGGWNGIVVSPFELSSGYSHPPSCQYQATTGSWSLGDTSITVAAATYITAGQFLYADARLNSVSGLVSGTQVDATYVSGTSIPITKPASGAGSSAALYITNCTNPTAQAYFDTYQLTPNATGNWGQNAVLFAVYGHSYQGQQYFYTLSHYRGVSAIDLSSGTCDIGSGSTEQIGGCSAWGSPQSAGGDSSYIEYAYLHSISGVNGLSDITATINTLVAAPPPPGAKPTRLRIF